MPTPAEIETEILALVAARGPKKTICPSEVVRSLDPDDWRSSMPACREVAVELAKKGKIEICQEGKVIDPRNFRGPIRLRLKGG